MNVSPPHTNPHPRGSTLLAVFWILAVLGFAVFTGVTLVVQEVDIQTGQSQAFNARQLADKGLALGAHPLVKRWDPLLHQDDGEGGRFDVTVSEENGRFGLNAILASGDLTLLQLIFSHWEMEPIDSTALASAMLDWVDADDEAGFNGAESDTYRQLGFEGRPFNRPFDSIDEVRLVAGMDIVEQLRPDWRSFFTLWSGSPKLNINSANAEALAIACECSIESAQHFVQQRAGADGVEHTEDDVKFSEISSIAQILGLGGDHVELLEQRLSTNGDILRIECLARAGDYRLQRTAILQRLGGSGMSFLHWEEKVL